MSKPPLEIPSCVGAHGVCSQPQRGGCWRPLATIPGRVCTAGSLERRAPGVGRNVGPRAREPAAFRGSEAGLDGQRLYGNNKIPWEEVASVRCFE